MTFTSKKEADAYDKMLDIADNLIPFLTNPELGLEDDDIEKLGFFLAQHKDELQSLLKGGAAVSKAPAKKVSKKTNLD